MDMITPEWVKDAVFYQIFPDRFAKSHRVAKPQRLESWYSPPTVHGYKGGDLVGVVERLDYLEDLGVTALYFNPIFQSASNHRYHTHDYFRVDPMLGGNEALRLLIDACHERGMKVVLDGVFNHASRGFFQFNDILENGQHSPYLDWFHVHRFPLNAYPGHDLGYDAWWGLAALPKFNTNTPAVREFLLNVAEYWLHFGIDGWRLDVPNEINDDAFWRDFRCRCRAINPDCYIVGELWHEADRWLQGDQFDAVMNYPFTRAAFGFAGARSLNVEEIKRCGYGHIPPLDGLSFAEMVDALLCTHRPEVTAVQLNLIGSHDTPRALTVLGDETAMRMALMFLLTFPGAPCIYYGDELGLDGGHDPACRQAMPWDAPEEWNHALFDYTKRLIRLRRDHPALRRGRYRTVHADHELYVYSLEYGDELFVGVMNVSDHPATLEPFDLPQGYAYRDVLGSMSPAELTLGGLTLPRRSGTLLRRL